MLKSTLAALAIPTSASTQDIWREPTQSMQLVCG
jgi:hypothetical protein